MGPHGLALLTEKTGGEALRKTWELRDNYNVLADWSFTISENLVIFTAHSNEQNGKLRSFLIERTLATIQALTEELLGGDAKPLRVQLDYKKPANVKLYEEVFRCPLRFAQEQSQIYYPQDWADLPLETYDPEAVDVLGALRTRLHKKLSSSDDIVQDVKMLLQRTPGVFPSLERVAESLAMSSRTLHRKLGQHNLHYQDLLDEERRQVAEELLLTTPMSIQQIAEQCGFADAQNFSQAFRRWQGLSPSEFRISYK
jgi:AraC-like DNA-binding protein